MGLKLIKMTRSQNIKIKRTMFYGLNIFVKNLIISNSGLGHPNNNVL